MARSLELDQKSRSELVDDARRLGVDRPERMTRVELVDEIIRRTTPAAQQAEARGLFGVARSMLASVVESGLNLPEAASVIRGQVTARVPVGNQAPVATVTLAEIYAAQGHRGRALRMIEEVLSTEPDHQEALRVQRALVGSVSPTRADGQAPAPGGNMPASAAQKGSELAHPLKERPATPDYIPAGFVETIGEEVKTGKPPQVASAEEGSPEPEPLQQPMSVEPALEPEPARQPEEASGVMEKPSGTEHEMVTEGEDDDGPSDVPALVVHSTERGVYLYWELPPSVLEQCGVDRSDGQACLRLVAITPSGSKPQRTEHTFFLHEGERLSASSGSLHLDPIRDGITVRAALGWISVDAFLPICVGRPWDRLQTDENQHPLIERARPHLGL